MFRLRIGAAACILKTIGCYPTSATAFVAIYFKGFIVIIFTLSYLFSVGSHAASPFHLIQRSRRYFLASGVLSFSKQDVLRAPSSPSTAKKSSQKVPPP